MKWLINDATFGLFTFKELTRSIAWLIDWPFTAWPVACLRKASRSRWRAEDGGLLSGPPPLSLAGGS